MQASNKRVRNAALGRSVVSAFNAGKPRAALRLKPLALACLLAWQASAIAGNCDAPDGATIAGCIAGAAPGDTVTVTSGTISGTTFGTLGGGVTLIDGGNSATDTINGGTLTMGSGSAIRAVGNTTLTTDISYSGTNSLSAVAGSTLNVAGHFNIPSGTSLLFGSASDTGTVVFDSGGNGGTWNNGLAITVNGGTLTGGTGLRQLLQNINGAVTVNAGGTLTHTDTGAFTINNLQGAGTLTSNSNMSLASGSFSGQITGAGALAKTGGGTLALTGSNSYAGDTTVNGGILEVNSGAALGGGSNVNINNGGELRASGSFTLGKTLVLDGAAVGIAATGGNTLTMGGVLNVRAGTGLVFGDAGAGSGTVNVGNAGISTAGAYTVEVKAGALTNGAAAGQGLNLLTSAATTTTVDSGAILDFGSINPAYNASIKNLQGAGTVVVGNSAAISVTLGDGSNFSGLIMGSGGLKTASGATVTLSGTSDYHGGTSIAAGSTLNLTGNTITLGSGTIALDGTLNVNRTGNLSLATLAGAGTLNKTGTGTLSLSSSNAPYSGTINVSGGTLALTGILSAGTATINLSGASLLATGNATVSGPTYVAANTSGTLAAAAGSTLTLSNYFGMLGDSVVFGDATRTGTVNLALSGGGIGPTSTIEVAGGTLTGNSMLGFYTGTAASTTVDSGATLNFAANSGSVKKLLGTGILNTGNAGTSVTLGNGSDFAGNITGSGNLATAANAAVTLSGANNYSGTTTIGNSAALTLSGNGTLGSGDLHDNGLLTVAKSTDYTLANNIDGNGAIKNTGGATLTLAGNNSYSGATNASNGSTIAAGSAANLGNTSAVTVDGGNFLATDTFTLNRAAAAVNTGSFAAAAGKTLTLSSAFTLAGGAALNIGSAGNTGTVQLTGATSSADTTGRIEVAAGKFSGSGGAFAGLLRNTGSVTVDNGATLDVSAGSNTIGKLLGTGSLVTGSGTTTTLWGGSSFSGVISGAGNLAIGNGGTVTLSGVNSYGGTTTVNSGNTLALSGNGLLGAGAVTLNGALSIDKGATSYTIGNALAGGGALAKSGSGILTLSGNNSAYTGNAAINAGALVMDSNFGGSINMAGGTTYSAGSSGVATVNTGALTFAAGSTYRVDATAAAADRTNVNGTLTINGGTVDVQATGSGYARNTAYTILSATGIAGTGFTGATSNLAFLTPTLSTVGNTIVLNLASNNALSYGSVAGTPNQSNIAGYLSGILAQGGNALTNQIDNLTKSQAQAAFDSLSGVQHAAASQAGLAMSGAFSNGIHGHLGSTGGSGNGFDGVGAIRGSALAFSSPVSGWGVNGDTPYQLAGMMGGSAMASSAFNPAASLRDAADGGVDSAAYNGDRTYTGDTGVAASGASRGLHPGLWAPNAANGNGLWSQALGTWGRTQGDGNGAGSHYGGGGFMVGADHALSEHWLVGAAAGYSRASWNASLNGASPSSGTVETPQGALYARYTQGPWLVSVSGSYAEHKFDTSRSVVIGPAVSNAGSSHHGGEWSADAQAEYSLASGPWQVRPLVGVRYSHLREDGFSESGAGAANLSMNARTTQSTTVSAGARVLRSFFDGSNGGYELKAVYSHLFGDNDSPVSARLAGQSAVFTASGTPLKRDALTVSAGIGAALTKNVSGFLEVSAEERGSGQQAYSVGGGLRMVW